MQALRSTIFLVLMMLLTGTAHARGSVPIVNLENNPVVARPGKELTVEEVGRAITAAGASQGYPWTVAESSPGKLKLSTLVRKKHTVVVEVSFDTKSYSIRYSSSVNMNYETKNDGTQIIHPFYNKWVEDLKKAIDAELLKA